MVLHGDLGGKVHISDSRVTADSAEDAAIVKRIENKALTMADIHAVQLCLDMLTVVGRRQALFLAMAKNSVGAAMARIQTFL